MVTPEAPEWAPTVGNPDGASNHVEKVTSVVAGEEVNR